MLIMKNDDESVTTLLFSHQEEKEAELLLLDFAKQKISRRGHDEKRFLDLREKEEDNEEEDIRETDTVAKWALFGPARKKKRMHLLSCFFCVTSWVHVFTSLKATLGEEVLDASTCPISSGTGDDGYADNYRGWYDASGCGICQDYCRWVGDSGSGGDPSVRTSSGDSFWSCRKAGGKASESGYRIKRFLSGSVQHEHSKCWRLR